ncbi:MAG: MMPL family transporter, partial [Flavisolibacter sp.]
MIGKLIHRYAFLILAITLLVSAVSIYLLPRLKTDVGFGQFALEGEPEFLRYNKFVSQMGSSDELFVLALGNEPTVFDAAFLGKVQTLKKTIVSMPHVKGVLTLLELKKYNQLLPGYFEKRPYLQASHPERFQKDSLLVFRDYPLTQFFLSRDARWMKLFFRVDKDLPLTAVDSLIKNIDANTSALGFGETHLMGRKYMESEFRKLVNNELRTSIVLSLLLVILILWLVHRTLAGVLLPLVCMAISLLMLYGYMALLGRPLTILSNLFPTLVLIIGISDVIHISSKYAH